MVRVWGLGFKVQGVMAITEDIHQYSANVAPSNTRRKSQQSLLGGCKHVIFWKSNGKCKHMTIERGHYNSKGDTFTSKSTSAGAKV